MLLDKFASAYELISALRDIVTALKLLYVKYNVVHRAIAPWNIMLQGIKPGVKGAPLARQGIWLDFSHAAFFGTQTTLKPPVSSPDTLIFTPLNALNEKPSTGPLDDIESIYYILCYILSTYKGKVSLASEAETIPVLISLWSTAIPLQARTHKEQYFRLMWPKDKVTIQARPEYFDGEVA
ncbi:hypothetical protein M422DRAFT_238775 [Sphaerobolus stellatus SS14]|nr:hypothetical protein M422DRAFT_238775 [Sphaerobolus stellatus SS14]